MSDARPNANRGANAWASGNGAVPPRLRVQAATRDTESGDETQQGRPRLTVDNYQNWLANVGGGTGSNLSSGSTYGFNPISRQRMLLEFLYRGSWVCGVAVDAVADDMVKMGIDYGGTIEPDDGDQLDQVLNSLQLWSGLNNLIKWGRLYGGAVAILMIAGQDPATPLRVETIGRGQFKGLLVLDRWMVEPSLNDLVSDFGPDIGLPKYYRTHADAMTVPPMTVHYSRIIRYEGIHLPYFQRITENLWGMSILERVWDRLTAFDSTTQGIAQLVYRAYLRIVKLKDLREVAGMSQDAQRGLMRRVEVMTRFQANEGITLLGEGDEFQSIAYAFAGLDEVLTQMGQQLCGALQIPGVRMFGQSPIGLNATGDSDWRNYFDGIHQQQELRLRRALTNTLHVTARSEGIKLPDSWNYTFRSLWQMTTIEKANVAEVTTRTILSADELGIVPRKTTMEELRQSGRETGVWATISDEMIDEASEDLPPAPGQPPEPGTAAPEPGPGEEGQGAPGHEPGQGETGQRPPGMPQRPPLGRAGTPPAMPERPPVPIPHVSLGAGPAKANGSAAA